MNIHSFRIGLTADISPAVYQVIDAALRDELGDLPGVQWELMTDTGPDADPAVLDQYDAVLAMAVRFPAKSFAGGLKRLAVIARWGVGYDRIDVPACTEAGVLLAITPDGVRRPVAEGIFALMFAVAKRIFDLDRMVRAGQWRTNLPGRMICLENRALGSVGLGNIGGEMFRIAKGLGMGPLRAYDPYANPEAAKALGVELTDLDTVLRESDFVAVNCFLNDETKGIINHRALSLMKPTAFLINTARGPIVDEKALYEALLDGKIAGAGLDVFEEEPTPVDNPLLTLDNVVTAPHAIAWTEEAQRGNSVYACRNIRSIYSGQIPKHTVNRNVIDQPAFQAKLARQKEAQ